MGKHTGKVALVTGGSTGIGFATAKLLVDEGATVFITGRREAELSAAAARIGGDIHTIQADSGKLADLDRVYAAIEKQAGKLDIVFANAGTATWLPLGEITEEHYDQIFDTNVKGVVFTAQKALPLLQRGGSIIINGSVVGTLGAPGGSIYAATKAAVRNLARSWTNDLKGRDIRVNVVSPGPITTPGLFGVAGGEEAGKEFIATLQSQVPLGRLGKAEEVARVVSFLASDEASFVQGTELFVDGGMAQV